MDSLTQIVLGAAVGEVVLGKKVGNRAMVWGAIAGTIPDLDILANLFMHPIEALAVHRGISHSVFFAVLFPWLIGWMTHRYYAKDLQNNLVFNLILKGIIGIFIIGFINAVAFEIVQGIPWTTLLITLTILGIYLWRAYGQKDLHRSECDASYLDWVKLHFWAIFTHPLLDSCTTYGTQLFQPFSDYRVGFNNVAVADPAYTAPFLVCVVIASFFIKSSKWRWRVNILGLVLSSAYLIWTVYNKQQVNKMFERSWENAGMEYDRYMTSPTILNNVLWYGVAQKDDEFYTGFYSLMDEEPLITDIQTTKQNEYLIADYEDERFIEIVKWFSNEYYCVEEKEDQLVMKDLRFGIIQIGEDDSLRHGSVFSFIIDTTDGFDVQPLRDVDSRNDQFLNLFWQRIKGQRFSDSYRK